MNIININFRWGYKNLQVILKKKDVKHCIFCFYFFGMEKLQYTIVYNYLISKRIQTKLVDPQNDDSRVWVSELFKVHRRHWVKTAKSWEKVWHEWINIQVQSPHSSTLAAWLVLSLHTVLHSAGTEEHVYKPQWNSLATLKTIKEVKQSSCLKCSIFSTFIVI